MEPSPPPPSSSWPSARRARLPSLGGARVGVLESRLGRELARLVERYGGTPVSAPALREIDTSIDVDLLHFVDRLGANSETVVVFSTGVAVTRLVEHAERIGRRADLVAALGRATTVCRGPKPVAALRAIGVTATASAREPFTTAEVLDAVSPFHTSHRSFAVVHYGERNSTLIETLRARDATVDELTLYTWRLPEDTATLRELVSQIVFGAVDALVVTCQVQVAHLFEVASQSVGHRALTDAFARRVVVVAAVGPRCRAALESHGVAVDVMPEHPKLGPMLAALARHFEDRPRKGTTDR